MPTQTFTKRREVIPFKLGLNNVVVADGAPVTSEPFSIEGYNQLTFDFELTRAGASSVTAYVETSRDKGTTWHRTQTKAIAGGTETMSPRTMSQAVTGSENWKWEFGGINGDWGRIVVTGVGGTTDRVTVSAQLGVV